MQRRDFLTGSIAAGCAAALGRPAAAELPAASAAPSRIPLEDFFRDSRFESLKLSPDGKRLACLVWQSSKHKNLATIDIDSGKVNSLTNFDFRDNHAEEFDWISETRLVFRMRHQLPDPNWATQGEGLWALNWDGSDHCVIEPLNPKSSIGGADVWGPRRILTYRAPVHGSDDILIATNDLSRDAADMYRVNSHNGRRTLLTQDRPPKVRRWVLDREQKPRVAVTTDWDTGKSAVHYRPADTSPWRRLAEWEEDENDGFEPLAFDYDGSLLVCARAGADKASLFRYDLAKGQLGERLAGHKDYDLGYGNGQFLESNPESMLIFDSRRRKLVGLRIDGDKPQFAWLDEDWARIHATLQSSLPGQFVRFSPAADGTKFLVTASSDQEPGRWYLYEPGKGSLRELAANRPWIKPEQMARRKPVRYTARDGLTIPAYLTLPAGAEAKKLPAVIHPHGGPYLRGEFWGFDPWVQFLASRGYAVLQAEYRGSMGHGYAHYRGGWREMGRAMQFDIADGARWLIDQGIADPKRIAILGHSAGGYATMMGLILEPDLYRCGANGAGPTDWNKEWRYRLGGWSVPKGLDRYLDRREGSLDHDLLASFSPVNGAGRIKVPVLMGYGDDDPTVPRFHADDMASALRAAKVKFELQIYREQGHWWDEDTRIDYFTRVEKFLADNLA